MKKPVTNDGISFRIQFNYGTVDDDVDDATSMSSDHFKKYNVDDRPRVSSHRIKLFEKLFLRVHE